jgi:23S rRNA (adenine2503-C2)-methyltransferase
MKVQRVDSSDTNVSKYVYDFGNAVAESVLYKYPTYEERTVICCSTQSGCPIGCRFCGAGDNFVRSLTAEEIVEQVQYLFKDRNIDSSKVQKGQIMFMSMGEPLLNKNGLSGAIRKLNELYPNFALLISTSAPSVDYSWIRELSVEVPSVGLQFSVHEAFDTDRDKLIPFKKKLTLKEIAQEGELWFKATGRQPFFNYCAHDKNTSQNHVDELISLFNPHIWQSTVSVICEREESIAAANNRQRKLATDFMEKLLIAGYSTRTFDPAGQDDVGGGCGQLWYVQDWMKNNPQYARPSIGRELPSVHTPREYDNLLNVVNI